MAFYIGTYQECLDYDKRVTKGESYSVERGINWGIVYEHPNNTDFAIVKHSDYESSMTFTESLPEDWFPEDL